MSDQSEHFLNVLLLEDNDPVADRLCRILSAWHRVRTVKRCNSISDALKSIANESFNMFIADLHLPDGSGIEALRAMKKKSPSCPSVVVSALNERPLIIQALQAGAVGYILKDDDSLGIIDAIEEVLVGHSPISAGIARHVINLIQSLALRENEESETAPALTKRELEILNAIAKGLTNKEVAKVLDISAQTVPVHIRNIYRKLQASNRSEAAYEARRWGII